MFVRELFGFSPPRVRMETGFDVDKDAVVLLLGRKGVALSRREVFWLIDDLHLAAAELARSVRA